MLKFRISASKQFLGKRKCKASLNFCLAISAIVIDDQFRLKVNLIIRSVNKRLQACLHKAEKNGRPQQKKACNVFYMFDTCCQKHNVIFLQKLV